MRPRSLIAAAALAACLVLPAQASATSVTVGSGKLTVAGGPGEVNDVLLHQEGGEGGASAVYVRESGAGAVLTVGTGCQSVAANEVRCNGVNAITVNGGEGDDKVVNETWKPATLDGGRGDDVLYGGAGVDSIDGHDGADTLSGGFGGDDLHGGAQEDTVVYGYAWYRVTADIDDVADDGGFAESDNVRTDVENLTGGRGADRLTGDKDSNAISGAEGDDELTGAAGDDALVGGTGRDNLSAGDGADSLNALDGAVDNAACGSGRDSIVADTGDSLASDCETSALTTVMAPPPPGQAALPVRIAHKPVRITSRGLAVIRVRCTRAAPERCTGQLTLELPGRGAQASARRNGRVLGSATFTTRRGRLAVVKVRLSRNGRRRVLRRRRVRCQASVVLQTGLDAPTLVRGMVTLEAGTEAIR